MTDFVIKHASGRKFIHPYGGLHNPDNDTNLVLHQGCHERMVFRFVPVEKEWGYIEHKTSNKIFHPKGGSLNPGNDTQLVLHNDRHFGALFAIDSARDRIVHKSGKFVHPYGGFANPGNDTEIVLHEGIHDAMKFILVDPENVNTEKDVYLNCRATGHWELLRCVENPIATHEYTIEYTVGKSESKSTTTSIEMKWESSIQATIKLFTVKASSSVAKMLSRTESSTWAKSTKRTQKIMGKVLSISKSHFDSFKCYYSYYFIIPG